jgi:Tol biopolymer transport system component
MGDYERVLAEATAEGQAVPRVAGILPAIRGRDALDTVDRSPLQYHAFAALTALGEYDAATTVFREIIAQGHESRQKFRDWCAKYVFDTLETGRSWHPAEQKPVGATVLRASRPRSESGTPSPQRGQDGRDTTGQSWHLAEQEPVGVTVSRASRPRSESGTPSPQRGQDGRDTTGQSWHPAEQKPVGVTVSRASRPRSESGTPSPQRGQDGRDTTGQSWHLAEQEPVGATVSRASRPRSEGGTPSTQRGQDGRDTIGRSWHLPEQEPVGAAFLPMVEAEETYRSLSAKGAHRLTTDGFSARWSPDGKKLAFSLGVQGFSGVAIFDPATKETDLLIVPGKDPRWSPDGKYIAFVRDCELLRLEELAMAERENQHRPVIDEQVWLMNADGTEPRRLVQGSWPSWTSGSSHVYYLSRGDNVLCSVPLAEQDREPQSIMKCSTLPSVSPDNRHVAHFENGSLKIIDLASRKPVAECRVPFMTWGVTAWSPAGNEVCLGSSNPERESLGLWLYDLRTQEFLKVLDGQITNASWSPMGTELACCLGPPYYDIWTVPVNPSIRTIEALGPGQTQEEHLSEMLAFYNRRIEADPQDAYAHSSRAHYYNCMGDRVKATADMRQWSAVQSPELLHDSTCAAPRDRRRVIHLPFDCELVFSAERPANTIPMMSVAFGQKGRCEMRLFGIPMVVISLLGFNLLVGFNTPTAQADFVFGDRMNLKSVTPSIDTTDGNLECFSYDGLEVYTSILFKNRPGETGADWDLCMQKRVSTDAAWGPRQNLGSAVNSLKEDTGASISADGLALYFCSGRAGGYGADDIYVATRSTKDSPWSEAVNMGATINSSSSDGFPWISGDELELYFVSWRAGGYGDSDIYVARRATVKDPWDKPVNLGATVNSAYGEYQIVVSPDRRLLFFTDNWLATPRPGGYSSQDIWMTRRASLSDPWEMPVNLGSRLNEATWNWAPRISADGRTFYYHTAPTLDPSTWDTWQVPIIPIVDSTGDGKVDGKDLLVMVMQLGGTDSLCDIGPYAWGDGVVDAKDLRVLAEYIGQGFQDPTLVAHWAFDETEGSVAADSAGDYDGSVTGGTTWQPQDGMVGGALKCDGVTGCVLTATIRNLGTGPFSVIAWVQGGAPGQVIVRHGGTTDWLMANPIDGSLMTKLTSNGQPLSIGTSEAVITDGKWHRIALVWDGADRILYVDGKEVARDPQPDLSVSDGKFIIGAGSKTGTGWSGLIDDVRIYSRIVRP